MAEENTVSINAKEYTLNYPSLGRINAVGKALGIDIMKDDIRGVDFPSLMSDVQKCLDILLAVVKNADPDTILMEVSPVDFAKLIFAFFLNVQKSNMTFSNGLQPFANMFDHLMQERLSPKATPSNISSTGSPEEARK